MPYDNPIGMAVALALGLVFLGLATRAFFYFVAALYVAASWLLGKVLK